MAPSEALRATYRSHSGSRVRLARGARLLTRNSMDVIRPTASWAYASGQRKHRLDGHLTSVIYWAAPRGRRGWTGNPDWSSCPKGRRARTANRCAVGGATRRVAVRFKRLSGRRTRLSRARLGKAVGVPRGTDDPQGPNRPGAGGFARRQPDGVLGGRRSQVRGLRTGRPRQDRPPTNAVPDQQHLPYRSPRVRGHPEEQDPDAGKPEAACPCSSLRFSLQSLFRGSAPFAGVCDLGGSGAAARRRPPRSTRVAVAVAVGRRLVEQRYRRTTGQVSVLVMPSTTCTRATTSLPSSSRLRASARAITS